MNRKISIYFIWKTWLFEELKYLKLAYFVRPPKNLTWFGDPVELSVNDSEAL